MVSIRTAMFLKSREDKNEFQCDKHSESIQPRSQISTTAEHELKSMNRLSLQTSWNTSLHPLTQKCWRSPSDIAMPNICGVIKDVTVILMSSWRLVTLY